jgi:hypothetical protein
VRPPIAILRLARRHFQQLLNQREIKIVENRSVIKKMIALAADRIAGKLATADGQIAGTNVLNARNQRGNCGVNNPQHVPVQLVNQPQMLATLIRQHDAVHPTAGARDDRRTAAGPPKNWRTRLPAGRQIDFFLNARRSTNDDDRLPRLPEPQHRAQLAGFGRLEQRLIERDVLRWRRQRQIEQFYGHSNTRRPLDHLGIKSTLEV